MNKRQKRKRDRKSIDDFFGFKYAPAHKVWRSKTRFNLKRKKTNIPWNKGTLAIARYGAAKIERWITGVTNRMREFTERNSSENPIDS